MPFDLVSGLNCPGSLTKKKLSWVSVVNLCFGIHPECCELVKDMFL